MSSGKSSRVDAEVARLLSKPTVDKNEFMRLRNKMDDNDLVDQIQAAYVEKYSMVEKRARAFAQKILEKYGRTNQPYSQLIMKAHKYAAKYELSDAEKTAFTRILQQELAGADSQETPRVTTNMSKVLGDISIDTKGFGMKVSDADYRELQDILKMREETKPLHSQVILQSLSYSDTTVATSGKFVPENGHNLACHVHPVVAALFLPKIDELEQHFLYSNLANIVASRYNQESFKTRPDYELFYNLVTDPNDVVCDSRSPVKDLKNRCHLQKQLWQSVLGLRNGQYYNCDQLDLLRAIDMCRLNKYDTPDLVYGRYDGTIVKRLFAAFSFRPTLVLSVPSPQVYSHNPYFQAANPVVSTISMINLRLPQNATTKYINTSLQTPSAITAPTIKEASQITLSEALTQSQLFFENGSLLMKNTQVISSRGVIVFFVDRRKHTIDYSQYHDPTAMVALPKALSGFERVNTLAVKVDEIKLGENQEKFSLKSVVLANMIDGNDDDANKELFVGSRAMVKLDNGVNVYNPMGAANSGKAITQPQEITEMLAATGENDISTRGMIFVFTKDSK
jgi:hypothetical protein